MRLIGPTCRVSSNCQELRLWGRIWARKPAIKQPICDKSKRGSVQFANEHVPWTEEQWMEMTWTDSSKFDMLGSDGVVYFYCPDGQRFNWTYVLPSVKHGGGNVMVWRVFLDWEWALSCTLKQHDCNYVLAHPRKSLHSLGQTHSLSCVRPAAGQQPQAHEQGNQGHHCWKETAFSSGHHKSQTSVL